jgi:hypothetical protein
MGWPELVAACKSVEKGQVRKKCPRWSWEEPKWEIPIKPNPEWFQVEHMQMAANLTAL